MKLTFVVNRWVMISALLYACAFIVPSVCHWFVFIYLIPLYYYALTHTHTSVWGYAVQGFWWGIIFFLLHMHALICMLVQQATLTSAVVVSMMLIGYSAAVSACWFAAAGAVSVYVRSPAGCLSVWVFVTSLFIDFVESLFFKIICLPRGYVFAYPLIPLAQHEALIAHVPYLPTRFLVLSLCASSACLAYALVEKKHKGAAVIGAFLFLVPFWTGLLVKRKKSDLDCRDLFVYLQPPAYNKDMRDVTPLELACSINEQLRRAVRLFPQAQCFLFPESTFPFSLDLYEDIRQLWSENALFNAQEITVVMASHHSYGHDRKNTLFCLNGCRIIQTYDKNTYLPFAEHMPWPWNKSSFFSEFLLKDKKVFHKVDSCGDPIRLTPDFVACPYMCSDLFFNYPRVDDHVQAIVWLVNDSWFTCAYYRHLMLLFAKLQATVYKRPILYIAHEFGVYIDPYAQHWYLPSVMIPKNVN